MKILLVNAPMLYVGRIARATASAHLQLIYSYLRERGIEVLVYDPLVDHGLPGDDLPGYLQTVQRHLEELSFDIAGISCWTSHQYLGSLELGRILRRLFPDTPIAVGGYHPTLVPEDFLDRASPFDWVVVGAGERFLLELCRRKPRRPAGPQKVAGQAAPLDQVRYDWSYPYHLSAFFLSRGCPHKCLYCSEPNSDYSHYSLDRAVEEYQRAAEHSGDGVVHLCDALFGARREWRRQFLKEIAPTARLARLEAEVRADQFVEQDVQLFGELGAQLYIGVETGSPRMLSIMRKTSDPLGYLDHFRRLLEQCDCHGVGYHLGMLYNHPGETQQTLAESVDFFWNILWQGPSEQLLDFVTHAYMFLPGSPVEQALSRLAREHGTRVHHPSWWKEAELDHWAKCERVTPSRDLSQAQAVELAKKMDVANWANNTRRQASQGVRMSSKYFQGIAAKPDE